MTLGLYGFALNLEFIAIGAYLVVRIIGLVITSLGTREALGPSQVTAPIPPGRWKTRWPAPR